MEPLLILQSTEDMGFALLIFYLIVFCLSMFFLILSIILYFKLWTMTNDVKKIKKMLEERFGKAEEE